jgi:hypothetical protein
MTLRTCMNVAENTGSRAAAELACALIDREQRLWMHSAKSISE